MNWYQHFISKTAGAIPEISPQQARDGGFFGPVYHGTTDEARNSISQEGFKVPVGDARAGDTRHGYEAANSYGNVPIPPPVHHLGYGTYFTTSKTVGKMFNQQSAKGLYDYYLKVPKILTINYGAPSTMMKWWIENGYDTQLAKTNRVAATIALTNNLKSKYDAVYFKGKGLRKLLDGDQIVVFEPAGKVFMVNKKLVQPGQIGGRVIRKADGMKGTIIGKSPISQYTRDYIEQLCKEQGKPFRLQDARDYLNIKWQVGGTQSNVPDSEVTFI